MPSVRGSSVLLRSRLEMPCMRSRAHAGSLRARSTSSRALSSNVPDSTSLHTAHSTILNIVVYVASVVCVRMPEWNRSSGSDSPVDLMSPRDNFTPLMHVLHIKTGFLGRGLRIPAGHSGFGARAPRHLPWLVVRVWNKPRMVGVSRQTRLGHPAAEKHGTVGAGLVRQYGTRL